MEEFLPSREQIGDDVDETEVPLCVPDTGVGAGKHEHAPILSHWLLVRWRVRHCLVYHRTNAYFFLLHVHISTCLWSQLTAAAVTPSLVPDGRTQRKRGAPAGMIPEPFLGQFPYLRTLTLALAFKICSLHALVVH